VKGNYSEEFKSLVMDMLQRDPESRPSAADLCLFKLPPVSTLSTACVHITFWKWNILLTVETINSKSLWILCALRLIN